VLQEKGIDTPNLKDVSDAVIAIRSSKLPDPKVLGNSGSFFKNPEIDSAIYEQLKASYPTIPGYPTFSNQIKVPAGWLIEQCGWKGKRVGNTGAHKDQALVLVNYGNATGNEIYKVALEIQQSVMDKFGIHIIPEVNII
jgi:UDP-N-acetylmuramate dehydrogenase